MILSTIVIAIRWYETHYWALTQIYKWLSIKERGWLENGNPIQEAIACDAFLISKDAPNPFGLGKCLSDYSDPREDK